MIPLTVIDVHAAANKFLAMCQECLYSDHDDKPRCNFASPLPSNADVLSAFAGNAQDRPSSRNYAARIAAHPMRLKLTDDLLQGSSWAETWKRLDEPCIGFTEQ